MVEVIGALGRVYDGLKEDGVDGDSDEEGRGGGKESVEILLMIATLVGTVKVVERNQCWRSFVKLGL